MRNNKKIADKIYSEAMQIVKEELLIKDFDIDAKIDKDIENIREQTREYLKTVKIDRKDGWWTTPRKQQNGKTVVPFESIEDDLYHFYFASSEFYDNRFELGIARIAVDELKFDLSMEYSREFMLLKKLLNIIMTSYQEKEKYDENLNNLNFRDLYNKYSNSLDMEQTEMKERIDNADYSAGPNKNYKIVEIENYEHSQLFYKYTNSDSPWCTTYSKHKYDSYTDFGNNKLYYIIYNDFKEINKPVEPYDNNAVSARWVDYSLLNSDACIYMPYDSYGLSMILLSVTPECEICCCASRWNHELGDFSRDYLNEEQLSRLLNVNFYERFCSAMSEHPVDESLQINENMLDNQYIEEMDDALHGSCHIWALNNYAEGDKFFVLLEYDEDIERTCLLHCGLYIDGKYVDCRGFMDTIDEVLEEFDYGEYDELIVDKDEFMKLMKDLDIL